MDETLDSPPASPTASNVPEYSVSEISGAVKRTLEGTFGRVRVRGEITELKRYSSGHIYFGLKDEGAKIQAVIWRSAVSKLKLDPENGVEIIASGKISSYPERSNYQLIVDRIEYAGAGALLARIEALRLKLAEEGLFDPARKRAFPLLPEVVGVVSSPQGAVIQDIRTTIARRFPRRIILWPVPVQGQDAARKIAAAIEGFSAMKPGGPIPRPDVLIVARGGGSLEDLMAFNDEAVVRAAANCSIPLISAVGHETDTTLIDFASDRRAPTPTAAAEMAVPSRIELLGDLDQKAARLSGALSRVLGEKRLGLDRATRGIPDLPSMIGAARQRLDDRAERLVLAMPNLLAQARGGLAELAGRVRPALTSLVSARRAEFALVERRLGDPRTLLESRRGALHLAGSQLAGALRHAVQRERGRFDAVAGRVSDAPLRAQLREARARLEGLSARLEGASYQSVLARGFALVLDHSGHPVTQASGVVAGQRLKLRFADGDVGVTSDGKRGPSGQGSLGL